MKQSNLLKAFLLTYFSSLVSSSPVSERRDLAPIFLSKDEYDKLLKGGDLNDIIGKKSQEASEREQVVELGVGESTTAKGPIEHTTVTLGSATVAGESDGIIGGVQRVANNVKRFIARLFTLYEDENRKVIVIPLFFPTVIG